MTFESWFLRHYRAFSIAAIAIHVVFGLALVGALVCWGRP